MTESFNDLFAAAKSGGKYPTMDELEGHLLLIEPSKIETVRNRFAQPGGPQEIERVTADVTVFEFEGEDEPQTFDDMFLSQTTYVNACRVALKPGNKPMILGVPRKYPTNATKEKLKIETPAEFAEARATWLKGGGKGPEPRAVWVLDPFDDPQAQQARAFLAKRDQFAAPTGD